MVTINLKSFFKSHAHTTSFYTAAWPLMIKEKNLQIIDYRVGNMFRYTDAG